MTDGLKKKRGWAAIGKPDVLPPALTRSTGKGSFHAAFSGWFKTALRNPNQISLRETLDMKSDAKSYMEEIVDPTIADFRDHPASRRHAFLACVATFHCIDYIAARSKKSPGSIQKENLRERFRKENSNFAIVDRVAHAFKHVSSGDPRSPQNQPLHVASVFQRPPGLAGIAQAGLSRLGDTKGSVEIWNEQGSDLLSVLTRAAEFLRNKVAVT